MTVLSDYVSGTISLTNGSVDFTGTGTGWQLAQIREGDTIFYLPGTAYQGVISEITSNVAGKLARAWEGPDLVDVPYRIRILGDGSRSTSQSAMLREQLGNGNIQALAGLTGAANMFPMFTGPGAMTLVPKGDLINGVAVDKRVNNLAERAAYDGREEGFSIYVANVGDGRAATYFKETAASGDWSDPAYITGEQGEQGEQGLQGPAGEGFVFEGAYNPATAYAKGDVVRDNGSSWIAIQATTGNAPPVLPTTSNAYWELLAQKGNDGAGTVSSIVAGRNISVDLTTPSAPIISGLVVPSPQGRPSLVSGVPLPSSDVVGATTIYYVPALGSYVPVWDGSGFVARSIGAQLSCPLDNNTGHFQYQVSGRPYDLWVIWDAGVARFGTGPSWLDGSAGSITARGTGFPDTTELELLNGILVNKNAIQVRYGSNPGDIVSVAARRATLVGSFYATANGQATDSALKRFLFSAYNQAPRPLRRLPTWTAYTYSTAAYRQANADTANQVEVFAGLVGSNVSLRLAAPTQTLDATAGQYGRAAIGIDSTTAAAAACRPGYRSLISGHGVGPMIAEYDDICPLGYHKFTMLESGAGVGVQNWYDSAVGCGLIGSVVI